MNQPPLLEDLYRAISTDMAAVEEEIRRALHTPRSEVAEMCSHLSRYGGKRLRPALVFLTARAAGAESATARHRQLAAVVELVHMATLVHDDVIDEAELRRSNPTVSARWSNYEAVLLGDVVFARAINLLGRMGDPRSLQTLTGAVSTLCEGEILQNRHRHDFQVSEETYSGIIEAKTAVLFAAACELAAWLAGCTEDVCLAFRCFGTELGKAFQIADDCLDLTGEESRVGKSLGTDVRLGKMTLPLILLRDGGDTGARTLVRRVIQAAEADEEDRALMQHVLRREGALDQALERARAHTSRGLEAVRGSVPPEGLEVLEAVAAFVFRRRA